jgi:hypothetical protein
LANIAVQPITFYVSYPPLNVYITGPSFLGFKETGLYTANASGGTGDYFYQWSSGRTGITAPYSMGYLDRNISVDVHDNISGQNATAYFTIYHEPLEKRGVVQYVKPTAYALSNNPNPFNPSTVIRYQLPAVSNVKLNVYDMLGREVETLVDGIKEAGYYTTTFNASRLPSGIYFARFTAAPQDGSNPVIQTMKMLLAK